jgi:hypothetical protein
MVVRTIVIIEITEIEAPETNFLLLNQTLVREVIMTLIEILILPNHLKLEGVMMKEYI